MEYVTFHEQQEITEVRFASFFPGGFTTMAVMNPPERKLANNTSVECVDDFSSLSLATRATADLSELVGSGEEC